MIDTGVLRPSLPKFTSQIIDREEVRKMIDARDQIISVQTECIAKQREVIRSLYMSAAAMRRTMYSPQSEESIMADAALTAADKWMKES